MEFIIDYGHNQIITQINIKSDFDKCFERQLHGNVNVCNIAALPSQRGLKDRQTLTGNIKVEGKDRKAVLAKGKAVQKQCCRKKQIAFIRKTQRGLVA